MKTYQFYCIQGLLWMIISELVEANGHHGVSIFLSIIAVLILAISFFDEKLSYD